MVGADPAGERVSQLWIDLDRGLPVQLVERFPVFGGAHRARRTAGDRRDRALPRAQRRPGRAAAAADAAAHPRPVVGPARAARRGADGVDAGRGAFSTSPASAASVQATVSSPPRPGPPWPAGSPPLANPFAGAAPYASNPPTSGAHLAWAPDAGVHRVPVPLPLQVHHLLDGGVALQYDCPSGCPDLVADLVALSRRHDGVLVAPYPWLDGHRLALTAWGHRALAHRVDPEVVQRFIERWGGAHPHTAEGSPAEQAGRSLPDPP